MCPPGVVSAISLGLTVLGTLQQARAQRQQGDRERDLREYNAAIANNNALRAERAAQATEEKGDIQAARLETRTRRVAGQARAQLAAQGQLVDEGSAEDLVVDIVSVGRQDALTELANTQERAHRLRETGRDFSAQAELEHFKGEAARDAARSASFGTLLTGGAMVAQKWFAFNDEGAFG